jgi:hypothetical protein
MNKTVKRIVWGLVVIFALIIASSFLPDSSDEGAVSSSPDTQSETTKATGTSDTQKETTPTQTPLPTVPAPIIFSDEQAGSLLLKPDDFPKNWIAKKSGMVLDAQNDFMTDYDAKMIVITLATHETEAVAQESFRTQKAEAQATIDGRGISGDKLEDVKKYPLFVWNASQQANISGVEQWTVIGVYGNITMKVFHNGSVGAPKKDFAVDIAKEQIDRITGD